MNRSDQRGSALIVSLIILIVMTVLGLTAMSGSGLQEKMAGNNRDMALAFQAAEAALRDGESYYENTVDDPVSAFNGANPGLYAKGSNPDIFSDATWENARTYSGAINGVASQPRYIIELIEPIGELDNGKLMSEGYGESSDLGRMTTTVVRVTARGVGGAEDTVVYLQSNYKKVYK